jgi:putative transposase
MPRQARIDIPGSLHHIICRGIERRDIFCDDVDRENFVSRLVEITTITSTRCFAWALIPNHVHLLLQTGAIPISTLMQKLLAGYATTFNLRHNRHGYLFQNRYKSIMCQRKARGRVWPSVPEQVQIDPVPNRSILDWSWFAMFTSNQSVQALWDRWRS